MPPCCACSHAEVGKTCAIGSGGTFDWRRLLIEQLGSHYRFGTVDGYVATSADEQLMRSMLAGQAMQGSCSCVSEFPTCWSSAGCLPVVASQGEVLASGLFCLGES